MFDDLYAKYGNLNGMGASSPMMDPITKQFTATNPLAFGQGQSFQSGLNFPTLEGNQGILGRIGGFVNNFGDFAAENQAGLNLGFSAAKGIADTWNTMKNNKLQEKALNFSMNMQNKNYNNMVQETNRELSDRQDRRVSANGGAGDVTSRDDYMKKWSAK